jgi:hypothetical protein
MQFIGRVGEDGKLDPDVRVQVADCIRTYAGYQVHLTVKKYRPQRSSQANRLYWALLTVGAESLGYDTAEELHDACAWKLLRTEDDPLTGTPRRLRTPGLNTQEFSDYVAKVERLLIEYGADLTGWMEKVA